MSLPTPIAIPELEYRPIQSAHILHISFAAAAITGRLMQTPYPDFIDFQELPVRDKRSAISPQG